jgi:hypothetical protein
VTAVRLSSHGNSPLFLNPCTDHPEGYPDHGHAVLLRQPALTAGARPRTGPTAPEGRGTGTPGNA